MSFERITTSELINVHKVIGSRDVVKFLKDAEKDFIEGLFYRSKHEGRATFYFRDSRYEMIRNRDFSFTLQLSPNQDMLSEAFA